MAKLGAKQIVCSLLVCLLLAPVVLAVGSPAFRFPVYRQAILCVPAFSALILGLIVLLVVLVWIFAGSAFSDGGEDGR